jgi:hypothetical protein
MIHSTVVTFPKREFNVSEENSNSVWVLFVMEYLREHFVKTRNTEALAVVEESIQKLELVLLTELDPAV